MLAIPTNQTAFDGDCDMDKASKDLSENGRKTLNNSLSSRFPVLILQHPQEKKDPRSSIPVLLDQLKTASLVVGLSWPNLAKAQEKAKILPNQGTWAVLYLGGRDKLASIPKPKGRLLWVDKKGAPTVAPAKIDGLIVLDGTWSQAKTLWWRNSWLLKLKRVLIFPDQESLYQKIRREPNKQSLSTLEAVGVFLTEMGEPQSSETQLLEAFKRHLRVF